MTNPTASNLPSVATILAQIESVTYPVEYAVVNSEMADTDDDGADLPYGLAYVSPDQDAVLESIADGDGVTELQDSSEGATYWLTRV